MVDAVGLSVVEACGIMWRGLSGTEKEHAARELGLAVSTIYQWGELREDESPRVRIPADMVARFCRVCESILLVNAIAVEAGRPADGSDRPVRKVTILDVVSQLEAPLNRTLKALEDGLIDPQESRDIKEVLAKAMEVVQVFTENGRSSSRKPNGHAPARTLQEAEERAKRS